MKHIRLHGWRLALVLASLLGISERAQAAVSTFNTSDEGWKVVSFNNLANNNYTIIGTYNPTYSVTGGNPGGFIFSTDPDGGDFTFSAPAVFLGDQSSAFGKSLKYDIAHSGAVDYQTSDVILTGGGLRLLWQNTPPLTLTAPWTTVTVPFSPSAQWHVGTSTGAAATASDFQTTLASLTGLYIRGEYSFGSETASLDNVVTPEPGSIFLGGAAMWLAGLCRRPRKAIRA
jgi:hypothetical protein